MVIDQQKNTQIEQNSILQNNIDNLKEAETLDAVHDYQKNINNFQAETESSILVQSIQAPEKSMLTKGMDNEEPSMLTKGLNEEKTPQTLSREELQKVVDNQTLKTVANERIGKCNELLDGLEGNRKGKKDLKKQVTRAIDTDLRPMTEDNHVYNNLNVYKNRLGKIVFDYYNNREPARQIIMMGGRAPVINGSADTKREARQDRRSAKNNANFQIDMSEIKRSTALYRLIGASANEWGNYCDFIGQGGIATSHPLFVQCTAGFNLVRQYNPDVYRAITPKGKITYDTYCQRNPQCRYQGNNGYNPNRRYRTGTIGDDIASMIEDQQRKNGKEVNPQQREARRKIGNIGSVIGCVALGFGIIRELFPGKDKKTNRGRVLGLGAGIFGITHYKDVKKTFFDAFNLDPDNYVARRQNERAREEVQNNTGLSQSEANELVNAKIAYPTLVATTIGTIPIKQLVEQKIVEEKDGKLVLNKANYATYVETIALALGRSDKDKQKMLDKVASDEAEKSISYGLSYCGINTLNDLNNLKDSETSTLMDSATFKTNFKAQIDAIKNKTGIFSNMAKQGFIPVGLDETIEILENYDSNKNENEQILQRLKAGLLTTAPEKNYSIKEMLNNPYINLKSMTMEGFTNDGGTEIPFDSYGDLFNTVQLTKRIKDNFSGRPAKSDNPFHIAVGGRVEFDDQEFWKLRKNETDVLKARTLAKTASTLKGNKQFYVDYLNKWRKEDQNRIIEENKVDLSGYPILKDVGINFTDENEAKKLETILEKIKNDLRFYYPTKFGNPFEIKDGVLKIKIEFTTIGESKKTWDISGLKTLSNGVNKEKLLKYLNDKTNKMWGSYL